MDRMIVPALTLALLAGGLMAAQPDPTEQDRDEADARQVAQSDGPDALSLSAYLEGTYHAEADFDPEIGQVKLAEYHAGLNAVINPKDAGQFRIRFDAGLLDYDITPGPSSVAGDAASIGAEFDDIYTLSLVGIYSDSFNDTTSWFVGAGAVSAFESDADFGDSIDWLVTAGFSYKVSDKLRVGLGVLAKSRLDDDVLVIPVPQIRYTIDERWTLESQRAGLKLNYKSSDRLSYGVMGEYRSVSFRLDDTHAAAVEGMATHRQFPVAIYAVYKPHDQVEIAARLGAALGGELEILDTNGDDVTKQDIDTAVFGSLNISFRF